jgi:hypothetical protein
VHVDPAPLIPSSSTKLTFPEIVVEARIDDGVNRAVGVRKQRRSVLELAVPFWQLSVTKPINQQIRLLVVLR